MATATMQNVKVVKRVTIPGVEPFVYLAGELLVARPIEVFDPPRAIADPLGGFASKEEKECWDSISDESWSNLDDAE